MLASIAVMLCMLLAIGAQAQTSTLDFSNLDSAYNSARATGAYYKKASAGGTSTGYIKFTTGDSIVAKDAQIYTCAKKTACNTNTTDAAGYKKNNEDLWLRLTSLDSVNKITIKFTIPNTAVYLNAFGVVSGTSAYSVTLSNTSNYLMLMSNGGNFKDYSTAGKSGKPIVSDLSRLSADGIGAYLWESGLVVTATGMDKTKTLGNELWGPVDGCGTWTIEGFKAKKGDAIIIRDGKGQAYQWQTMELSWVDPYVDSVKILNSVSEALLGKKVQMKVRAYPLQQEAGVWSITEGADKASIDAKGVISFTAPGIVKVKVESTIDAGKSDEITFNVKGIRELDFSDIFGGDSTRLTGATGAGTTPAGYSSTYSVQFFTRSAAKAAPVATGDTVFAANSNMKLQNGNGKFSKGMGVFTLAGDSVTHTWNYGQAYDVYFKLASSAKKIVLVGKANSVDRSILGRTFAVAPLTQAQKVTAFASTQLGTSGITYGTTYPGFWIPKWDGTFAGTANTNLHAYALDGNSIRSGYFTKSFENGMKYSINNAVAKVDGANTGVNWADKDSAVSYIMVDNFTANAGDTIAMGGIYNQQFWLYKVMVVPTEIDVPVTSLNILNTTAADTGLVGSTMQLVANAAPLWGDYEWSILSGAVNVTLNTTNGLLKFLKPGTVKVRVAGKGVAAEVADTVEIRISGIPATGVTIKKPAGVVPTKYVPYTLSTKTVPSNASDTTVVWSITKGGAYATITAAGVLKATKADTVIVKAANTSEPTIFGLDTIKFTEPVVATGVSIDSAPARAYTNNSYTLYATVLPANTTFPSVKWSIKDRGATDATLTQAGVLTSTIAGAVKVGVVVDSATAVTDSITVTFMNKQVDTIVVTNAPAEMAPGDKRTLTVNVLPADAANKDIVWSITAGSAFATIVDTTGVLTAVAEGSVTVRAAATDGSGKFTQFTFSVVAPQVGGTKKEVLVVYENFGGNGSSVDGITPAKWAQIHVDSCADTQTSGWRDRPENAITGVTGSNDPGRRSSVLMPQITASSAIYVHIDTIVKYKPSASTAITLLGNNAYTYNNIALRNGYKVGGATSIDFKLQNMAVAPNFYQPLCYDTIMAPGGKFTQTSGAGWYNTYQVPSNAQSERCNCADADDKGYLFFANALSNGAPGNLTIPADAGDYFSNLSKVEFVVSSGRVSNRNVMVVMVEYVNDGIVDTFTYNSINYMPRKVSLALKNGDNNKVRIRFATSPTSGNTTAPLGFDYPLNTANGASLALGVQTVDPHTFNRAMVTGTYNGVAYGGTNNIAMQLHWLKLYALANDPGYSITLNDKNSATTLSKNSGISFGDSVTVENSNSTFRGWRISGREDMSETATSIKVRVTDNMTITPLYAGDKAVVAVVDENFRDWDNKSKLDTAVANAAAGLIKFADATTALADYGLDSIANKSINLKWGFTTPSGADRVNVKMKYLNVAPNSTIRVSNAPGAEQWKGFIGFGARTHDDKGYFEIDSLAGITKAVVEFSNYNPQPAAAAQAAVAVLQNDTLIRNVANLMSIYAKKEEIALNGGKAKLTIGYANQSTHEFLTTLDTGSTTAASGAFFPVKMKPDTYGQRVKTASVTNVSLGINARYSLMHSLKLYAEVTLPAVSDDATLRELTVNITTPRGVEALTLSPAFNSDSLNYTVSAAQVDSFINIAATANYSAATIRNGDLGNKKLAVGDNTYTIQVTAEDLSTLTYTIKIKRISLSKDATLKSLTASGITLTPVFNPATTTYTANVANSVSSTTITGVPNDAKAAVTGNGEKTLAVGVNSFRIKVTAEDTLVTRTYTVNIMRQQGGGTTDVATDEYAVRIYPNPVVAGELTVEDNEWKEGTAIEIYDVNGALVAAYKSTGERTTLKVSQLPNGTYLLKAGKKNATKFVKQ